MADASVDIQATNIYSVGANFKTQNSGDDEPSVNPTANDESGNVSCEKVITDTTNYSQNLKYCGTDFIADFKDTSTAPVPFLENFGGTFNSKLVTAITISFNKVDYCTIDITSHNHEVNAHDGGATPTGATRSDALALGICDVVDFLPNDTGEAFDGWNGFGIPDFGITLGEAAPDGGSVSFSFGSHNDKTDDQGDHLVGKNLTPKCELSLDFVGVPTSNTKALINIDLAANTEAMLGAVCDSVATNDDNLEFDTFSCVIHAYPSLATA